MKSVIGQIEAAIIAALSNVLGDSARIQGFLESTEPGIVKTSNSDGRPQVFVKVVPPTAGSYANNRIEYNCSITVSLDYSDDPTVASFDPVLAEVESLLLTWNDNSNITAVKEVFSTADFDCRGFLLSGGDGNLEGDRPTISVSFSFAVAGRCKPKGDNNK